MARLLPCGQYAFVVALLALPIRATYLRCARLLPCGQYAFAIALLALPIRATCAAMCSLRCAHTPRFSGSQSIPPSHLFHICRRQMSIPPRIFFTSAVGRCPSPPRIFFTSAVGRCPFPLAMHKTPAPRASLSPHHA